MPNEIKSLLDGIISDTKASYPDASSRNDAFPNGPSFDEGSFREKLSMFVLKDIICAMMHDDTKDVDGMIDDAIMKHITDNYDGSCYGYLCRSRDTLKSPVLGDIIQEIDEKTKYAAECACRTKNVQEAAMSDAEKLLDGVENYEDLRIKLKKQVSDQVVKDVTDVITKSNDAPIFTDIDKKITVSDKEPGESALSAEPLPEEENDVTTESVILRMCGVIINEAAIEKKTMSVEEGMNRAIIQYCLAETDRLFKQRPRHNIYAKL